MIIKNITLSILFLIGSLVIPFFFEEILFILVGSIGLGWVLSTIIIRVTVILLFALALKRITSLIPKFQRLRFLQIFLIALLPGFGISFIAPIYTTDYGNLQDEYKLPDLNLLETAAGSDIFPDSGSFLITFMTLSCGHCEDASQKLGVNQQSGQKIPVIALFAASEGDISSFLDRNRGNQFQAYSLADEQLFINASGGSFPSIFWVDEGKKTYRHWSGDNLNYTALDYLKSLEQ